MTISAAGHQARSGRIDPNSQSNTCAKPPKLQHKQEAAAAGGTRREATVLSSRAHGSTILVHGIADAQEYYIQISMA